MQVQDEQYDCNAGQTPQRNTLDAAGVYLSYLEWGSTGYPALLLHGITSSAQGWWSIAPRLVAQGYHVFAPDMPGHGQSGDQDDHRIEAIAATVGALLSLPALANTILIGHSWGGAVALALASGAHGGPLPQRTVLADPALRLTEELGTSALTRYLSGVGLSVEENLAQLRAEVPGWHECDYRWKALALAQCRSNAVEGFLTKSGDWDLVPLLAEARMPLLLLVADPKYTVIRPDTLLAAHQAVNPSLGQIMVLPDAQHNLFRTTLELFLQVLLPWLASPIEPIE